VPAEERGASRAHRAACKAASRRARRGFEGASAVRALRQGRAIRGEAPRDAHAQRALRGGLGIVVGDPS
jgi:hypothetical protein